MVANIVVEIPYQIVLGVLVWLSWYWAVFGYGQTGEQRGLMLLFLVQFFVFASTFAHLVISFMPDAETAGAIATLLFSLSLTFNGVLQTPAALPGFWIFMYRISPFTYTIGGMAATAISGKTVECAQNELAIFDPPSGQTCGAYLERYLAQAPGYLLDAAATSNCSYCPIRDSTAYLSAISVNPGQRWRNFAIGFAYIIFNIFAATSMYYLFRVRKVNLMNLAKGPATLVDRIQKGIRRLLAKHEEPPPAGKENINNRAY